MRGRGEGRKGTGKGGKGSEGRLPPLKFKSSIVNNCLVFLILKFYSLPPSDPQASSAPGLPPAKSGPKNDHVLLLL